jgi:hypothetical protein
LHPTAAGIRSRERRDPVPSPLLADRGEAGATVGYVCEGFTCAAPARDAEEFRAALPT